MDNTSSISYYIIVGYISYMAIVAFIFFCLCCCKDCVRCIIIYMCSSSSSLPKNKKEIITMISNDSFNKIVDLNEVIVNV